MTREDLYSAYREIYPHFLICTHTCKNYTTVGLTRHSGLMLSHYYNYKKIIMIDDNLIDIVDEVYDKINTKEFIDFLFSTKILDNATGYISLAKCKLFEYINNYYANYKVYNTDKKIQYFELNKYKTLYQQYPLINPHRQKFYLLNSEILLKKKITFRIDLPIAEDINFTKDIYMSNMSVIVINYQFIEPFTNRRPMVCLSNYTFEPNKLYRCLSKKQKECFLESGLINTFSDIFIWKGRIIYYDEIDIYAGSSVYGPYRLLSKTDYKSLVEKYPEDYKNFITTFKLKGCTIYCKKPNPNNIELINNEINNRIININNYVSNCNLTMEMRNELDKVFRSLDMADIKDNNLNIGIGMNKYALHFEYIDDMNHYIFVKMLQDNIIENIPKDINYLSTYFENYENNNKLYHKILTVYSIYSKYLFLDNNIDHVAPNSIIKGLLIFGNKFNVQYYIYNISFVNILNAFLDKNKTNLKKEFDLLVSKIMNF